MGWRVFIVLCACLGIIVAQDQVPIDQLPEEVEFEKGKVSLFAEATGPRTFRIFVINDSKTEIVFPAQDGDIFLKQEVKINERWVRVEPHVYSWCGNSYHAVTLKAKHSMFYSENQKWGGPVMVEESGVFEKLPIRYRFYSAEFQDVYSNEIQGEVSMNLARLASTDSMAIGDASPEKLEKIVRGEIKVTQIDHIDPRFQAMEVPFKQSDKGKALVEESLFKILSGPVPKGGSEFKTYRNTFSSAESILGTDFLLNRFQKSITEEEGISTRLVAIQNIMFIKCEASKKIELLKPIAENPNDAIAPLALRYLSQLWSAEETITELKRLIEHPDLPSQFKEGVEGLLKEVIKRPPSPIVEDPFGE